MRMSLRTIAHLPALLGLVVGVGCKEAEARTKGVGDSLRPFIVMNCESAERYCQVCAYGGKPKIMFVADVDDTAAEADLLRIQKIVDQYSSKGLVAFALFGQIENGKFTPVSDEQAVAAKLKEMTERLKLTYPVTIVPSSYTEKEKKGYTAFVDSYDIATSRRLLYADAKNKVSVAESVSDAQAEAQFGKVEAEAAKL
jgi:hypothetical protein